ncbi:hypothetical protein M9H77_19505 [Catharanthus roseus]|uniref:Uncharacterized protein n=1 Tax=Catharanthus roseus TaxID=4058 RepID=A0ACC0BAL2_CATRO|nr:hypothetical protein M9H77_19505 [Catharanthus roseus]
MPGQFGVSREEKKRERNREKGLSFHLLGHLFDFPPSVTPQCIILQQVVSEPGSGSLAPASDNNLSDLRSFSDLASEFFFIYIFNFFCSCLFLAIYLDLQKENQSHGENLFVRGRIDRREPLSHRFKSRSKSREKSKPNFSFPLQPNDVNRKRNRERGLLVTSVTAEAISEGIIPDHPLAYLRRLDAALPLLGDLSRSIILQQ